MPVEVQIEIHKEMPGKEIVVEKIVEKLIEVPVQNDVIHERIVEVSSHPVRYFRGVLGHLLVGSNRCGR